jgi:hypothetical protein
VEDVLHRREEPDVERGVGRLSQRCL